jgi:hypothetical protein
MEATDSQNPASGARPAPWVDPPSLRPSILLPIKELYLAHQAYATTELHYTIIPNSSPLGAVDLRSCRCFPLPMAGAGAFVTLEDTLYANRYLQIEGSIFEMMFTQDENPISVRIRKPCAAPATADRLDELQDQFSDFTHTVPCYSPRPVHQGRIRKRSPVPRGTDPHQPNRRCASSHLRL